MDISDFEIIVSTEEVKEGKISEINQFIWIWTNIVNLEEEEEIIMKLNLYNMAGFSDNAKGIGVHRYIRGRVKSICV